MKIVLLTRTVFHHTYFINRLQKNFQISCVVRESYPHGIKKRNGFLSVLKSFIRLPKISEIKDKLFLKRFNEMYSAGFRYHPALKNYLKAAFDVVIEKPGTKYLNINCGEVNSSSFVTFLKDVNPDIVVLLGSSIVKPNTISTPSVVMMNIHTGLSPYYRGTWSYGWPIVNNEPEYIGATLHKVDKGVDTGDIICQTKPVFEKSDDLNAIFLKVVSEGIELALNTIENLIQSGPGTVKAHSQPQNIGRQYYLRDFNAEAAYTCLRNLENGMIEKYNLNKEKSDSQLDLYGYVPPKIFT